MNNIKLPDDYFGLCPHCKSEPEILTIKKNHYAVCRKHKVFWLTAYNILESNFDETKMNQIQKYLTKLSEVKPFFWPSDAPFEYRRSLSENDSQPVNPF